MRVAKYLVPLVLALPGCAAPAKSAPARALPAPAIFEFHSDRWVNLHQRLLAEAQVKSWWHTRVTTCPCARTPDGVLPEWSSAVDAYRNEFADRESAVDVPLHRMNWALARIEGSATLPESDVIPAVAHWLPMAMEPYTRISWPEDDARNRAWIAAVEPLVAKWGRELSAEMAMRFDTTWPQEPIRVEVTQFASWGGAYTNAPPTLITMSSDDPGYRGPAALEMLFHEASHTITDKLVADLEKAFGAHGKTVPEGLDHVIIFYTAGELARRRLGPDYIPYGDKNNIYKRGWAKLVPLVREHWRPWLDGSIDLHTALDRIAQAS